MAHIAYNIFLLIHSSYKVTFFNSKFKADEIFSNEEKNLNDSPLTTIWTW